MYSQWAAYYDAIYAARGKDYAQEAQGIHVLIQQYKRSPGDALLDVACGTGGHIPHLRENYMVEGLDLDPEMLAIARHKNPDVVFHRGDMVDFELGRRFDAIVCLFSSIAYTMTVPKLRRALTTMRRHLDPGGVVIIEPFISPEGFTDRHVSADFVDQPDFKLVRMCVSRKQGTVATLDFHFLVATPQGIRQFSDRHDMALFTHADYTEAFRAAAMEAIHDPQGLIGRGLYIATA